MAPWGMALWGVVAVRDVVRAGVASAPWCLVLAALALPASAQQERPQQDRPRPDAPREQAADARPSPADRTTRHEISPPGGPLRFSATVSTLRLVDAGGAPQAEVVATAFLRDGDAPRDGGPGAARSRPVTFALNGGPGASSAWLNLGSLGPWRVPMGGDTVSPSAPPVLVENRETWLAFTDLVFLDPPGTGYSRVLAGGDDARRRIWSVGGDITLLADAMRRWLETNGRMASPKFIAGESYGGFRVPRLVQALREEQGVGVSGMILVSPVLDFAGRGSNTDPFGWVTRLPSMAAAAGGTRDRVALREVEEYAAGEYLLDLVRGERDRAAVDRAAARVAALTGLDPALVRRRAGRVDMGTFLRERTREAARLASPYDATVTALDPFPASPDEDAPDPVLDALRPLFTGAAIEMYTGRLGWAPEGEPGRRYRLLNESIAREWDYGRANRPPESLTALRQSLALDPALRVLVVHGLYDLVTPYFASELQLAQVPEAVAGERLRLRAYPGGHMFYSQDASRAAFQADAEALVSAAATAAERARDRPADAPAPVSR